MRYVLWALKAVVFLAVVSFAARNVDPVTVRYYLGAQWQAPLIFVLLVAFCIGAAAGIVACLGRLYRQRREILRLREAVSRHGSERGANVVQGVPDGN